MDAKQLFCLVVFASLLAGCGQPAATATPMATPTSTPAHQLFKELWSIFADPGTT